MIWGKLGDEGVDRNFKEARRTWLFKTSVTAELYTHFAFINSAVSQPAPPAQRLQWKITQIAAAGDKHRL